MRDPIQSVTLRCPHCAKLGEFRGEYRTEMTVRCGECRRDVTREFKRQFFKGVAADINFRLVERDNRGFLKYLAGGWPDEEGGGPDQKG